MMQMHLNKEQKKIFIEEYTKKRDKNKTKLKQKIETLTKRFLGKI